MKIGVFVGSFNPVHIGHKKIIDHLLNNKYLDKIIIIPTGNYWDKQNLIDIKDRINMLKFYENKNVVIDEKLNKYQYTYEILNELKKTNTNNELYLILGADNIIKLHLWNKLEEILKHKIIVLDRNNIDIKTYISKFKEKDNFIVINDFDTIEISSTEIRNNIDKYKSFLDKPIYNYIKEKNIFNKN